MTIYRHVTIDSNVKCYSFESFESIHVTISVPGTGPIPCLCWLIEIFIKGFCTNRWNLVRYQLYGVVAKSDCGHAAFQWSIYLIIWTKPYKCTWNAAWFHNRRASWIMSGGGVSKFYKFYVFTKRAQHAAHNPNSKRWDYSCRHSRWRYGKFIKWPTHMVDSVHHLRKRPQPQSMHWQ